MQILQEFDGYVDSSRISYDNETGSSLPTLPPNLTFTRQSLYIVIAYGICFLIASIGNLTVFVTLSRGRYRKSRISLMICHLSIADLLVAFFTIPIEIGWRLTVQWVAGNSACKIFLFLRAFGLYLSNNILICVSLDRYFAVLYPLRMTVARRRGKMMLTVAWIFSIFCAVPQSIFFHVQKHPEHSNFTQCVTFNSFSSDLAENTYNVFCIVTMYFFPLVIICCVYLRILWEISSKSRENNKPVIGKSSSGSGGTIDAASAAAAGGSSLQGGGGAGNSQGSKMRLRRSDMTSIERARSRTLRMTIKIVVVFIFCWTPYITMSLWYVIDKQSAKEVDELLQESLFIMAVGNSCANPLVYGSYAIDLKKECCRCFLPCTTASRRSNVDVHLIQRSIGSKFQPASDLKSPGVSKQIVHSVRQAVHGFFKVGSGQTKSTNVVGLNKALAVVQAPAAATTTLPGRRRPTSPKPSVSSINDNSLAVAVARQTEKVQLCTMIPILKTTCSEPGFGEQMQQTSLLNSPSAIVEPRTA
ncbi:gonadotropin-releasing hormone II receptor-like isoform X1 [Trichogramma pretiosum]|uniref:gonadotropin-releasing hormone II receptor-like isoform X1 n=1 Tax=Trichogramma pretiosum TaxID=7493 RepID=UPI000C71A3BD|nr:gonadotropin-releasing hormone II receptor-like isoform X1 [Trichogramma pretiosum]